jgi:hypothetical protein
MAWSSERGFALANDPPPHYGVLASIVLRGTAQMPAWSRWLRCRAASRQRVIEWFSLLKKRSAKMPRLASQLPLAGM